jgi:hypothetical protein
VFKNQISESLIIEPGLVKQATELPQHITDPAAKELAAKFYGYSVEPLRVKISQPRSPLRHVTQPVHECQMILIRPTEQER